MELLNQNDYFLSQIFISFGSQIPLILGKHINSSYVNT
jgi:hypothetical protein